MTKAVETYVCVVFSVMSQFLKPLPVSCDVYMTYGQVSCLPLYAV